jgi:gamma-glutamyltranspeptidase/glutathione hydrolase
MSQTMNRRQFLQYSSAFMGGSLLGSVVEGQQQASEAGAIAVGGLPIAAAEGFEVLRQGGNAIDAAVTAALAAGVAGFYECGIGGYGGHMTIALPGGKAATTIDFNTQAPAAARDDMFRPDSKGQVKGRVNEYGWLASGVPGTLAGLQLALDRFGSYSFRKAVQPALRLALDGFSIPATSAQRIAQASTQLQKDPASTSLFFKEGKPLQAGARYRNPDLGKMLQTLAARNAVDSFYRGDIGKQIAKAFQQNGGLVTEKDMAAYQAREVKPLHVTWSRCELYTAPLAAGGLTMFETINILKALNWQRHVADAPADPKTARARLEAMRLAWHDRLNLLGDPDQVKVPVDRLLSEEYAGQLARRVEEALAADKPVAAATDGKESDGTIHISAADAKGMLVALTLTHGGPFGAQVAVPGLGLILGHGMARFDPRPGQANSPGPGKRPLHNMCPTIVLRNGQPVLAIGGRGGRRIPNSVLDVLTYALVQEQAIDRAINLPRLHTEGGLELDLDGAWPAETVAHFQKVGYRINKRGTALVSAVAFDPKTRASQGAAR